MYRVRKGSYKVAHDEDDDRVWGYSGRVWSDDFHCPVFGFNGVVVQLCNQPKRTNVSYNHMKNSSSARVEIT